MILYFIITNAFILRKAIEKLDKKITGMVNILNERSVVISEKLNASLDDHFA
ncbi:MAG: hypothetical protein JRD05_08875 [Deltaproteobacteria bacterium]|nr:hypothetical protein [Deltaproteobacteria bacterium]